jgi:DNA-binding MarR family transcriptional regulator
MALGLTSQQKGILVFLFRFRFLTTSHLSSLLQMQASSVNRSLRSLQPSGYIARRYSSQYKIDRRGAEYYLTKDGLRLLMQKEVIVRRQAHPLYKNESASDAFVARCLMITELCSRLKKENEATQILTRSELYGDEDFPVPGPDLYMVHPETGDERFIYVFDTNLTFVLMKQLKLLIKHYELMEWEGEYPTIVFICVSESSCELFLKKSRGIREEYEGELHIEAITFETTNTI